MKAVAVSLALAGCLFAKEIVVQQGWNLIGVSAATSSSALASKNPSIKKIFTYKNGAYTQTQELISPNDGLWIYSEKDTSISTEDSQTQGSKRADELAITQGWNLLSVPVESVISPRLFADSKVFKYKKGVWYLYDSNSTTETPPAPPIDFISKTDGFWLFSDKNVTLFLNDEESRLLPFATKQQMSEFIKNMVIYNKNFKSDQQSYVYYPITGGTTSGSVPVATPAPAPSAPTTATDGKTDSTTTNTTTTNLQELAVDEADIVKNDGKYAYYLSKFRQKIVISSLESIASGAASQTAVIALNPQKTVDSFFLQGSKLIVIYGQDRVYWDRWYSIDYGYWSQKSEIAVYDVSNLQNITQTASYEIDARTVDSRIANGKLYLVTRYLPYIVVEYPKKYVDCQPYAQSDIPKDGVAVSIIRPPYDYCYYPKDDKGYYTYDYDNPVLKEEYLTTTIKNLTSGAQSELFSPQKFFAPSKMDQQSFITTITAFELSDFSKFESISAIGASETLYASENAVYTVSKNYPLHFGGGFSLDRSAVYKFDINGSLGGVRRAFVDGSILNKFSLSEHLGTLRVASTVRTYENYATKTDNVIYTIKDENASFTPIGKLSGLGKEGETIKAVRFVGDNGFVVTFKNTDPLYTIDLSDPKLPKKAGELSISGYSTYFHPVDSTRLLSIGRDANESGTIKGLQIQLFDISNLAKPTLADKITIGDNSSYTSEAENNHKAFTYRNSDGSFAFDLRYYGCDGKTQTEACLQNVLSVYKVSGMKLVKQMDVEAEPEQLYFQNPGYRSIIFDLNGKSNAAYFSNGKVFSKGF